MAANLKGKKALVTGGARRIGRAVSLKLAEQGVHVSFTYNRSSSEALETEKQIRSQGVECLSVQVDLIRLKECERLVEEVTAAFSQVDILVNNASQFPRTDLEEVDRDVSFFDRQLEELVALHMRAPLYLGIRLGLQMKRRGWGRIVNLTDRVTASGQAYPGWALYQASKYGLFGATQALAVELSPEVTVNAVAPGLAVPPPDFSQARIDRLRKRVPLGREVGAEEIAADVLYLIGSEGKTGSTIVTDGGASTRTD